MKSAELDGITIGYEDHGGAHRSGEHYGEHRTADPVLLLVHGHPFDRSMWAPQVRAFALEGPFRLIVPDLRGYGATTVVPGVTRFSRHAEDLAGLLDQLHVRRVVIGGLSMGGQIAMEFCRLFRDRVEGVVLADTSAAAETEEGRRWRAETADRLLREGMTGYADEVLAKMIAPYNVTALPDVARHVRRMMCATDPEGAAAALRGRAERPDYRELLTTLDVPALVVVGRDDPYTPVADAKAMHAALPDSELVVIEGAAHMPNLERPDAFNAALGTFLDRFSPLPRSA
ncbi:alpha/beta fold hydrolase [Streptomyces sp. GC420]|uniref:alpha/beta fold hydrolase n=1 Tax=Streptomyces sp. GC420 TaxID=2697568 RepID=UPI001415005E|nr:alpha/beta hydrolase [Streptomyces sp. GC420]NBM19868.1 alpha/beta fold hydrolase [Streptomyces sp. GC420]